MFYRACEDCLPRISRAIGLFTCGDNCHPSEQEQVVREDARK